MATALVAACGGGAEPGDPVALDPAAAVSSSGTATDVGTGSAAPDEATDDPESEEDPDATQAGELGPIDPLDIAGQIINEYDLVAGECFNRFEGLEAGRRLAITARVGCDEPHSAEVYHTFELDAAHPAVYPGDDAVRGFALRVCYENFEGFVGEMYELSVYEIGVFIPNRTNFEHEVARYRRVHCWLHHLDDEPLVGTAAGTAL